MVNIEGLREQEEFEQLQKFRNSEVGTLCAVGRKQYKEYVGITPRSFMKMDKQRINNLAYELYESTSKIQCEDSVIKGLIDKLKKEVYK